MEQLKNNTLARYINSEKNRLQAIAFDDNDKCHAYIVKDLFGVHKLYIYSEKSEDYKLYGYVNEEAYKKLNSLVFDDWKMKELTIEVY